MMNILDNCGAFSKFAAQLYPPPQKLSKRLRRGLIAFGLAASAAGAHAQTDITNFAAEINYDATTGAPAVTLTWTRGTRTINLLERGDGGGPITTRSHLNIGALGGTAGTETMFVDRMVQHGQRYRYRITDEDFDPAPNTAGFLVEIPVRTVARTAAAMLTANPGAMVLLDAGDSIGQTPITYAWNCAGLPGGFPALVFDPTDAGTAGANNAAVTFTAPMLTAGATAVDRIKVTCTVTVAAGGQTATAATTVNIIPAAAGGDDAVDRAVLPEVLRGTTRGIHNGIFQRILRRQTEDGQWK